MHWPTNRRFCWYESTACLQLDVISARINPDKGFTIVSTSSSFMPMDRRTFVVISTPDGFKSNKLYDLWLRRYVARDWWIWIVKNCDIIVYTAFRIILITFITIQKCLERQTNFQGKVIWMLKQFQITFVLDIVLQSTEQKLQRFWFRESESTKQFWINWRETLGNF